MKKTLQDATTVATALVFLFLGLGVGPAILMGDGDRLWRGMTHFWETITIPDGFQVIALIVLLIVVFGMGKQVGHEEARKGIAE